MADPTEIDIAPPYHPADLLFLAGLAGLVALAWVGFAALGGDYPGFWQRSGALIGLGIAALGWAWGSLDRHPGLISANPRIFASAALQMAGLPLTVFGNHLTSGGRVSLVDRLAILPAMLVYAGAVLGWLLLIAPAQYFLFLVAAAPSRVARASSARSWALLGRDGHLRVTERPVAPPDPGWWDASMRDRPVSMAGAFVAAGFAAWNLILAAL